MKFSEDDFERFGQRARIKEAWFKMSDVRKIIRYQEDAEKYRKLQDAYDDVMERIVRLGMAIDFKNVNILLKGHFTVERLKEYVHADWVLSAVQYKQNGDLKKFRNQIKKILEGKE